MEIKGFRFILTSQVGEACRNLAISITYGYTGGSQSCCRALQKAAGNLRLDKRENQGTTDFSANAQQENFDTRWQQ